MIRDATIFVIVDEKSADFRIAVVKCLLARNMNDDLFYINDPSTRYNLAYALRDKAVLAHFRLDASQSWTISSIRAFLQQHHPEMLTPSSDAHATAVALSSSGIAVNPETAAAVKKQEEAVELSSLTTSPVVLPDQNAAASEIDDEKSKLVSIDNSKHVSLSTAQASSISSKDKDGLAAAGTSASVDLQSIKLEIATSLSEEKLQIDLLKDQNAKLSKQLFELRTQLEEGAKLTKEGKTKLDKEIQALQSQLNEVNQDYETRLAALEARLQDQQQRHQDQVQAMASSWQQSYQDQDLQSILNDHQKLLAIMPSEEYRNRMSDDMRLKFEELIRSNEELQAANQLKWEDQEKINQSNQQQLAEFKPVIEQVKRQLPWMEKMSAEHAALLKSVGCNGSDLKDKSFREALGKAKTVFDDMLSRCEATQEQRDNLSNLRDSVVFKLTRSFDSRVKDNAEIDFLAKNEVLSEAAQMIRKHFNKHFYVAVLAQSNKIPLEQGKLAKAIGYLSVLASDLPFAGIAGGLVEAMVAYAGDAQRKARYRRLYDLIPNGDMGKADEVSELFARKLVLADQARILEESEKGSTEKLFSFSTKESYVESELMKKSLEAVKNGKIILDSCKSNNKLDYKIYVGYLVKATNPQLDMFEVPADMIPKEVLPLNERDMEEKVAGMEETISQLTAKVVSLEADMTAKDREIQEMAAKMSTMEAEMAAKMSTMEAEMVAKDQELKEQMAAKDQAFQELKEQMAAKDRELKEQMAAKDRELKERMESLEVKLNRLLPK
jgi:hypothetical protein